MRRLIIAGVAGLVTLGLSAGCSSGSDGATKAGGGSTTTTVEPDGGAPVGRAGDRELSLGGNKLPAEFPKRAVPLPKDGTLQAAINYSKGKDASYSLSYGVASGDVAGAAKRYKNALEDDGYRIESSASAGAAAAVFSAYTAVGKRWDVVVYNGGGIDPATRAPTSAIALQVTPHDPVQNPDPGATAG